MVLKNGNRSQNTGNTLRKRGLKHSHAVIVKKVTIPAQQSFAIDNSGLILKTCRQAIDDGNLMSTYKGHRIVGETDSVPYSLNKKERWNLPGLIRDGLYVSHGKLSEILKYYMYNTVIQ